MQARRRVQNPNDPSSILSDSQFCFEELQVVDERRPEGYRFSQFALSIHAKLNGRDITACGEGGSRELAEAKAFSELIERASLISYGKSETSNGWAAHPDRRQARANAICELIERDAVLSQWYSAEPFLTINSESLTPEIQKWVRADLSKSEYPRLTVLLSTKGVGPSVTCILSNENGFGVCAHATRRELDESIHAALAEACRGAQAAIRRESWKDTLHLKRNLPGPIGPGAHALYRAYHSPFPKWMFGATIGWQDACNQWSKRILPALDHNSDFEFHVVMERPLFVGFATHPETMPLHWGTTNESWVMATEAAKRLKLTKVNREPHIVS